MSEATNNDIFRELGRLSANVDGLRRDLSDAEDHSREYREKMYGRVEDIATRTDRLEMRMAKMEPAVSGLVNLRAKAAGVILALGLVGTAVGWALSHFASAIKDLIVRSLNLH